MSRHRSLRRHESDNLTDVTGDYRSMNEGNRIPQRLSDLSRRVERLRPTRCPEAFVADKYEIVAELEDLAHSMAGARVPDGRGSPLTLPSRVRPRPKNG